MAKHSTFLIGILCFTVGLVLLTQVTTTSGVKFPKKDNSKILVGYFARLSKYGSGTPLPASVSNQFQLLEEEMGPIIPMYDVIIQTFIKATDFVNGQIVESKKIKDGREGVNGKKGLKALCEEKDVLLVISVGGGSAAHIIPNKTSDFGPVIDALYDYVIEKGYDGIDIDEENEVDMDIYTKFMKALAIKFHSGPKYLTVSVAIGPLFCCYGSRGICKLEDYVDWVFLMLYDGLTNNAAFDTKNQTEVIWQPSSNQQFCANSKPEKVSYISTGACQFINYALFLNYPANKLIMGLPSYSYPSSIGWNDIQSDVASKKERIKKIDDVGLITQYSNGEWIPTDSDIKKRISYVLDPQESKLGVTVTKQKLTACERSGQSAGITLLGAGYWQIGMEDNDHYELSLISRRTVDKINSKYYSINSNYDDGNSTEISLNRTTTATILVTTNNKNNNGNHSNNSNNNNTYTSGRITTNIMNWLNNISTQFILSNDIIAISDNHDKDDDDNSNSLLKKLMTTKYLSIIGVVGGVIVIAIIVSIIFVVIRRNRRLDNIMKDELSNSIPPNYSNDNDNNSNDNNNNSNGIPDISMQVKNDSIVSNV